MSELKEKSAPESPMPHRPARGETRESPANPPVSRQEAWLMLVFGAIAAALIAVLAF
jgi:hypothetical protein